MIFNSLLLKEYGFSFTTNPVAGNKPGYEKTITHSNGTETLWINICVLSQKVYLYNEFECGGLLWEKEIDIPETMSINEDSFIDWLNEEISCFITE